jgi:septal ring factor EnvC (AmiA/AmiB activator)
MSDTPKTDALSATFYLRCDDCPQPDKCERMLSMHPDDARDIERKLTEAAAEIERQSAAIERLNEQSASLLESLGAARRQRDEAIAALRELLRVTEMDEPRFNEYHDACESARRLLNQKADEQPNYSYERAMEVAEKNGLPTKFPL